MLADRCDRCPSRAYVLAGRGFRRLYFCAHHGRQHFDALVRQGWIVRDYSDALAASPS